jgi:HK97 family phage prohead protease
MELERRFCPLEIRAAGESSGPPKLAGYAAVFDSLSVVIWGFRERIAPGAFADGLANGDDVRALWNHNTDFVLGRTKNGTLNLAEDETGLAFELEPPDTQLARDLVASVARGDVDQMSFGFVVLEDDWDIDDDDQVIRTLRKIKLYEISPVTFPAYNATSVGLRGEEAAYGNKPEIPAAVLQAQAAAKDQPEAAAQVRAALRMRRMRLAEVA